MKTDNNQYYLGCGTVEIITLLMKVSIGYRLFRNLALPTKTEDPHIISLSNSTPKYLLNRMCASVQK